MRRVVLCGLPVAVLGLLAGVATVTDAATPAVVRPAVAEPSAVAPAARAVDPMVVIPIEASAQVGPARAVRMWSECILTTINEARAGTGARPLKLDLRVSLAAFGHSTDQALAQSMSHSDAAGTNAGTRLQAAGYNWSTWGENVAAGQADCATVTAAWLGSSTHRANIMNPLFRDVGVAMVLGANGVPYWTMDLAAS